MILSHSTHPALTLRKHRKWKPFCKFRHISPFAPKSCVSTVRSALQCKQCNEFIASISNVIFSLRPPRLDIWPKTDIEIEFSKSVSMKILVERLIASDHRGGVVPPLS